MNCDPVIIRANHISYAFRLEDKGKTGPQKFKEYFKDDHEHGMGHRLLNKIKEKGTNDIVLICVRWAGITKLGPLRFKTAIDAAQDVLNNI